MEIIYIALIALANNVDNIGARIVYCIRGIKVSSTVNLWISIITFLISFGAAFFGKVLAGFLSQQIAYIISAIILSGIGLWIIFAPYLEKNHKDKEIREDNEGNWALDILKDPGKADLDCSKDIDFKEATLLGIACSINNIGGCLGAGMIGLNSVFVGFFSAIISFLVFWAGNYITDFINKRNLGHKATVLAGIFMILLGLKQII